MSLTLNIKKVRHPPSSISNVYQRKFNIAARQINEGKEKDVTKWTDLIFSPSFFLLDVLAEWRYGDNEHFCQWPSSFSSSLITFYKYYGSEET